MNTNNSYTITAESIDSLIPYWLDSKNSLSWHCLFMSPLWMKSWWDVFGSNLDLRIYVVRHKTDIIGIAPLVVKEKIAGFVGNGDVCDYLDFIISSGREAEFFRILVDFLRDLRITHLELTPLHRDSTVFTYFAKNAESLGCNIRFNQEDVLFELILPATWDAFLGDLTGKYRHEIRRKSRRLEASGHIRYRVVDNLEDISNEIGVFISLFKSNRVDKSDFMTDQMVLFFQSLAETMARYGILKLFFLERERMPIAGVMCFDYHSTIYLYNNGYDNRYANLSVGLLSKIFSIKDSIENGKASYNFLKGNEPYKKQLGGIEVPIYNCRIEL